MGVAAHVVMETAEGGESEKEKEEVEEIGSIVVESLLLMDHSSSIETPFKVLEHCTGTEFCEIGLLNWCNEVIVKTKLCMVKFESLFMGVVIE